MGVFRKTVIGRAHSFRFAMDDLMFFDCLLDFGYN